MRVYDENRLLPKNGGGNLSHQFTVTKGTTLVHGFNIPAGAEVHVEIGVQFDCEDYIWGPYRPCGSAVFLTLESPMAYIKHSGSYRVYVKDPSNFTLDDLKVFQYPVVVDEATVCCC